MYQVGDKIVCIDNSPLIGTDGMPIPRGLTKYKTYQVVLSMWIGFSIIIVIDDFNLDIKSRVASDFVSLLEFRSMKINKVKKSCSKLEM